MERDREVWAELHRRFDPSKPVGQEWRVPRHRGPAEKILEDLELPWGEQRSLVFGTQGTGKTTELWFLRDELEKRNRNVIFLDVEHFFSQRLNDSPALQHVQPWEILMLCGLAVYQAGVDRYGHKWKPGEVGELKRAIAALSDQEEAQIDVGGLAAGILSVAAVGLSSAAPLAGAAMTAGTAIVNAVRFNVQLGQRRDTLLADQEAKPQALLRAVNQLLGVLSNEYGSFTLILDGLDRIEESETNDRIFVRSSLLRSIRSTLIVACSLELSTRGRVHRVKEYALHPLPNVPVLDHDNPEQPGPGVETCLELWRIRTADIGAGDRISEPALRVLAFYSGGRFREFNRLVRVMCGPGWTAGAKQLGVEEAERAVDERRAAVEIGINSGHLKVLRELMDDPDRRRPEGPLVEECILYKWLFPYPNEATWWYPNPMLTRYMLKS